MRKGNEAVSLALDPRLIPAATGSRLYLDYISGEASAARFYTYAPLDFEGALAGRQKHAYPRRAVARLLAEYNVGLGADACAMGYIEALADPDTYCVITGQQAGLMGGPAYTAYKIITTIRLANHLSALWGCRVLPVFWLASEDHDLGEINHAYAIRADGEMGRARFAWDQEGRPISDLPITDAVQRAYDDYWRLAAPGPHSQEVRELFSFEPDETFCGWQARIWSRLFSAWGLVVVEPHTVRAAVPDFLVSALKSSSQIRRRLSDVAAELTATGYAPALTSEDAGLLYTFDGTGERTRVRDPGAHVQRAAFRPELYSTDAALRPLLADAALPVVASVLGPGETAYQGMLKSLYELFGVPQPLLYPRHSYTVVAEHEAERLASYQTSAEALLSGALEPSAMLQQLLPAEERGLFRAARGGIEEALVPLRHYLADVDPSLTRTWMQTLNRFHFSLDKLEKRALKARLGQLGYSRLELRRLQNALLPRGRLQERVLPLPHFLSRHGMGFLDRIYAAGELGDWRHHVLRLGVGDA
jgi:bacillithiol biosynthesis cysteine-adding enzyme BshC